VCGDDEGGAGLAMELPKKVDDRRRVLGIERTRGLVGENDSRPLDDGRCYRNTLSLTARELIGKFVGLVSNTEVGERLEAPLNAPAKTLQLELQGNVLNSRQEGEKVVPLEHEPKVSSTEARTLTLRKSRKILAADPDAPRTGGFETTNKTEQG
jgi:hypothetical protein